MDSKNLLDLPKDIYNLFDPEDNHICSEESLDIFASNIKDIMRQRLLASPVRNGDLRFSALGKPNRQIWLNAKEQGQEKLLGKTFIKFLYGDLIEQMLLFLTKEAGHIVEREQEEVSIDGIKGHIDAVIDGVVVDVKSASPYGYKKFAEGRVAEDDSFGYVEQLSGYASVLTPNKDAAWLAIDKVSGDICVSALSKMVISHHSPTERIIELKKVLESDEIPELCYPPIPDGSSGNYKLDIGCSFCPWKFRCYPDLRVFSYSTGPRFLTKVALLPKVDEITRKFK